MTIIAEWAAAWGIPAAAIADLAVRQGALATPAAAPMVDKKGNIAAESYVQSAVRLDGARKGVLFMRNNSGALPNPNGVPVRFGLMNDNSELNARFKSSDLIGIRKVLITSQHVGQTIGQFCAREVKEADWRYTGRDREVAQQAFLTLVNSWGGDGKFATDCDTI